jgi:hypothetical protein
MSSHFAKFLSIRFLQFLSFPFLFPLPFISFHLISFISFPSRSCHVISFHVIQYFLAFLFFWLAFPYCLLFCFMSLRFLSFYLNSVHLISSHLLWLPFASYVIFSCIPFDSFISVLLSFHAPHFFSFHLIPFGFIEFHACLRSCHIILLAQRLSLFLNQVDSDDMTGLPPIASVAIASSHL